jgi:hypothetical protein
VTPCPDHADVNGGGPHSKSSADTDIAGGKAGKWTASSGRQRPVAAGRLWWHVLSHVYDRADGDKEEEEEGRHGKAQQGGDGGEHERYEGLHRYGVQQPGPDGRPGIAVLDQSALDLGPCSGLVPAEHAASLVPVSRALNLAHQITVTTCVYPRMSRGNSDVTNRGQGLSPAAASPARTVLRVRG